MTRRDQKWQHDIDNKIFDQEDALSLILEVMPQNSVTVSMHLRHLLMRRDHWKTNRHAAACEVTLPPHFGGSPLM